MAANEATINVEQIGLWPIEDLSDLEIFQQQHVARTESVRQRSSLPSGSGRWASTSRAWITSTGTPGSGITVASWCSNRAPGTRDRATSRNRSDESMPISRWGISMRARSAVVKPGPQPTSRTVSGTGVEMLGEKGSRDRFLGPSHEREALALDRRRRRCIWTRPILVD
jgi:hypothetical protein